MSLKVPAALLEQAGRGEVGEEDFVACIRESLPYAWGVVSSLARQARQAAGGFADDQAPPPSLEAQGQLLRMMASDAMRGALERHFGVRLAFQNCHRVGVFGPGAADEEYRRFVSPARSCSTSHRT